MEAGAADAFDSEADWPVTVDVVVESVGPATWDRSVRALRPGGRLVVCGGTSGPKVELNLPRLFFKQIEIIGSTMGSYPEFDDVTRLVGQGLPVQVDEVFDRADYPAGARAPPPRRAARQDRPAPPDLNCSVRPQPPRCPVGPDRTEGARRAPLAWPAMEPTPLSDAKARLAAEIDRRADLLVDVSHQIHARPELGFEERFAHELLTGVLEDEGLAVTRSAHGVETAFEARAGTAGPTVAVVCEYDALPGIGHACGHNIIATAGLGRGPGRRGAGRRARRAGASSSARPAEEGGGGKVPLIDGGAFAGVDAAMMVHPADADLLRDGRRRPAPGARHVHGARRPTPPPPRTRAATPSTPRCSAT